MADKNDPRSALAGDLIGVHEAVFGQWKAKKEGRRNGTIVCIRRWNPKGEGHIKDPMMKDKLMESLKRGGGSRGVALCE